MARKEKQRQKLERRLERRLNRGVVAPEGGAVEEPVGDAETGPEAPVQDDERAPAS
jgi:hypothetical protein